jgi:hypothetical protein
MFLEKKYFNRINRREKRKNQGHGVMKNIMREREKHHFLLDISTVGGQIKLGHLKFNLCKSDH